MQRDIRHRFPQHRRNAQILNEDGIGAGVGSHSGKLHQFLHLLVTDQCVECHVDLASADMAVAYRFGKFRNREILGPSPGIESVQSHIYGIRAVLNCRDHRFR